MQTHTGKDREEAMVSDPNYSPGENSSMQRSCLERWFGRMERGSFRAGTLSLTATAIGGGILLPRILLI